MIYAVVGTDLNLRKTVSAKRVARGQVHGRINEDNYHELPLVVFSASLFETAPKVYVLEEVVKLAPNDTVLHELFEGMKNSIHHFYIDEPFADAATKKLLKEYALEYYDAVEVKEREEFPRAFVYALSKRDKKTAWLEFVKLRDQDAEKTHGLFLWQIKKMRDEGATAYSKEELATYNELLVDMFHRAHRGEVSLITELEKFVLML